MPGAPSSFHLAFDHGAESGRALRAQFHSGILTVEEIHRFPNEPVHYDRGLHWDVARLWHEMRASLSRLGSRQEQSLSSIGVDTWGLDYALLGEDGALLENPYHYRDSRTEGIMERVCSLVSPERIYEMTGIQFMPVNGLYQLFAANLRTPGLLKHAKHLVMIPDLFNYWLTGMLTCEFTDATTTQFLNPRTHTWSLDLLRLLDLPSHFLGPVIEPGTVVGSLLPELARGSGVGEALVVAPACHDTGSAVAAIPNAAKSIFISSGTWSLLGTELQAPLINHEAQRLNFTNEGGVCGTVRFLKNIAGLWLLQACRRCWQAQGIDCNYSELTEMARSAPSLESFVDPDSPIFLRSENMPESIDDYCRATHQPVPRDPGACTRLILESLALKYRYVIDRLESLTRTSYPEVRIVGGGAKNTLLNQFTAEATGKRVIAGPIEATALGNVVMQMLATGTISSLEEGREVVDRSFPVEVFEPQDPGNWHAAYRRFQQYCQQPAPGVASKPDLYVDTFRILTGLPDVALLDVVLGLMGQCAQVDEKMPL